MGGLSKTFMTEKDTKKETDYKKARKMRFLYTVYETHFQMKVQKTIIKGIEDRTNNKK